MTGNSKDGKDVFESNRRAQLRGRAYRNLAVIVGLLGLLLSCCLRAVSSNSARLRLRVIQVILIRLAWYEQRMGFLFRPSNSRLLFRTDPTVT